MLIVNVADVAPAATVTDAGTVATDVSDEVSEMTAPPVGAAADSVTVPVDVPPAATEAGEIVKVLRLAELVGRANRHSPRPYVPAYKYPPLATVWTSSTITLGNPAARPALLQSAPESEVWKTPLSVPTYQVVVGFKRSLVMALSETSGNAVVPVPVRLVKVGLLARTLVHRKICPVPFPAPE